MRGECYTRVRLCLERQVTNYYLTHPELSVGEDEIEGSRVILVCILDVLDGYNITERINK